jgi:hypothetical protein
VCKSRINFSFLCCFLVLFPQFRLAAGHPGDDAGDQANYFVSNVGGFGPGDFAILDIEVTDGADPDTVAQWSLDFVNTVMSLTGLPASQVMGTVGTLLAVGGVVFGVVFLYTFCQTSTPITNNET